MQSSDESGQFFEYGQTELDVLCTADSELAQVIRNAGILRRKITPGTFKGLVRAISGQQISGKAHAAIWKKITLAFNPLSPELIAEAPEEKLRECGLSMRKSQNIKNIALEFLQGNLDDLEQLPDEELVSRLCQLKGVGKWTAEMLMIFTFQRKNILSFNDLAIQRGIKIIYGLESLNHVKLTELHIKYSPYATIASFYLWHIANTSPN